MACRGKISNPETFLRIASRWLASHPSAGWMVAVGGEQRRRRHPILTVGPFTVEMIKEEDRGGSNPLPIKVNRQITWEFMGSK